MSGSNSLQILNSPQTMTLSAIFDRLRSELKLKMFLTVALNLWMFLPYHFLQWHHFFPSIVMPESFCDRLIPFSDRAVWIYLSIYLLMPVGPFLMKDRGEIGRYALGVGLIGVLADFVFIFWPTWCPRPPAAGVNPLYRMLIGIDNPFHAFPSLHAAFAIFSALCADRVLREMRSNGLWRSCIWIWAGLILFAASP